MMARTMSLRTLACGRFLKERKSERQIGSTNPAQGLNGRWGADPRVRAAQSSEGGEDLAAESKRALKGSEATSALDQAGQQARIVGTDHHHTGPIGQDRLEGTF